MPSTPISGNSKIAVLDSRIVVDFCTGKFLVDVTPSVWIGSGASNVSGAKIRITNVTNSLPVVIKDYGVSYDIAPPMSATYEKVIPTQAGGFQYGKYTIDVLLYDGSSSFLVSKTVEVCPIKEGDKVAKSRELNVLIKGSCSQGKAFVSISTPAPYNGILPSSITQTASLLYPTGSGLSALSFSAPSISVILFEGVYRVVGSSCVSYPYGDNVFIQIKHILDYEKNVRCFIDECAIFEKLSALNIKIQSDCSDAEREESISITVDALRLLKTAQLANECGADASEYLTQLENLLGYQSYSSGAQVINNSPSKDFVINGCNVTKSTEGLTDTYTIENYEYKVAYVDNGGILVVSNAVENGCTKVQTITFDAAAMYASIKVQSNANETQRAFWANVIFQYLQTNINGIVATSFAELIQGVMSSIEDCCSCSASILTSALSHLGANVKIDWTQSNAEKVEIYIDGNYVATVLSPRADYTFVGAADGLSHDINLFPICENGKRGVIHSRQFEYLGCPAINVPSLTTQNANGVACPFNLSTIVNDPPAGISIEWHTQNNTSPSSLVPNVAAVTNGIFYAFAKDASGCYSAAVQVQVICQTSSCSAPQNISISAQQNGFMVRFNSAAFPPPSNSYTVKRRVTSDPDISASYATIGSTGVGVGDIQYNATNGKWEILDTSAVNNVDYTYVVISNCGATTPSIQTTFANYPTCPVVTGVSATMV